MRNLKIFIVLISLLSLVSCDKEVQPKDYPYVTTNLPNVYDDGAEFSADITNLGNQEILKYGFVWGKKTNPTVRNSNKLFEEKPGKGVYSYKVNSGLAEGQTYYVRAFILTDQYEVYGNEKSFISQGSLPPVLNNFEPKFGPVGTKVIIDGENFSLSKIGNNVKFGNVEVIIDSVSENRLMITIPKILQSEKVRITIETAGMEVASKDSFDLWFPWEKIGTFNENLYKAASFSYKDKGYIIQTNSTSLLEYNPAKNLFKSHGALPEGSSSDPLAASSETKAIVLLNNNLYEIELSSFVWSLIANYPQTRTDQDYLYYINNEIYLGSLRNETLLKYDINNNDWISMAQCYSNKSHSYSYATYKNFGYIYSYFPGGTSVYRFDPSGNLWVYLSDFPFSSEYNWCQFYIGGKIYAGFGQINDWSEGYVHNQIWEYNEENDKWTRYNDCPQKMRVELSLTINEKGYAFSLNGPGHSDLNDVWEFDPTKN